MATKNFCTFYIVRHGQSEANVANILAGHHNAPLTEKGKEQAKLTGEKLKDISFDAVFSSDLTRARQTAEAITLERKLVIKTMEGLREKFYGHHEGRMRPEVMEELKDLFKQQQELATEERMKFRVFQDGETDHEAVERFMLHLREIAVAYTGKTVLITCHAGIMRYFLIKLGLGDYNTLHKDAISNAGFMKVESDGIDFFVRETNGIEGVTI